MISIWIIILLMLALNMWVWFFSTSFINFIKFGKGAKVEISIPSLKEIWIVIEHPLYVWIPRVIFSIGLLISIIIAYLIT
jgi:hypothetical protein